MIYLDYSANTPVDARVLEQFCAVERRCIGNANSHHQAGSAAKAEIDAATIKIASLLGETTAETKTTLTKLCDSLLGWAFSRQRSSIPLVPARPTPLL